MRLKVTAQTNSIGADDESVPPGDGTPVCGSYWQQVKLAACAALCSASTAGAGTVLCGWACWCMFCTQSSAVAGVIC